MPIFRTIGQTTRNISFKNQKDEKSFEIGYDLIPLFSCSFYTLLHSLLHSFDPPPTPPLPSSYYLSSSPVLFSLCSYSLLFSFPHTPPLHSVYLSH
ncbi:unnamed protein product [Meloidogyne enterolobii]|uniref:Uncharacterized protein n=2 Tax=Meloidogyne enterolobii TaxID=390850 RepID=A0ACB0YTH3_MELEN|nr:unnamed protein product [Meloidogyne enterolobii]